MKTKNLFYLFTILLVEVFTSCDKKDPLLPKFSINPDTYKFKDLEVGERASKEFVITNAGHADLLLNSFHIEGDAKKEFSVKAESGTKLSVGKTYSFNVFFSPNEAGDKNVKLKISTNDGEHIISLTSKALPASIEFVYVEGGTLSLGNPRTGWADPRDHPLHPVTISSFNISKYEITSKQYVDFLNANKVNPDGTLNGKKYITIYGRSEVVVMEDGGLIDGNYNQISYKDGKFVYKEGTENYPATWITWEGANAFAKWKGGRLPTEAEWEYAARGGQKSKGYNYSGSNNVDEVGWYVQNSHNPDFSVYELEIGPHPIGQKKPNELGIYDMTGNVWEWCNDWYSEETVSTPEVNPQGPSEGTYHHLRGGAYDNSEIFVRVFIRFGRIAFPADSYHVTGFRIVKDVVAQD